MPVLLALVVEERVELLLVRSHLGCLDGINEFGRQIFDSEDTALECAQ